MDTSRACYHPDGPNASYQQLNVTQAAIAFQPTHPGESWDMDRPGWTTQPRLTGTPSNAPPILPSQSSPATPYNNEQTTVKEEESEERPLYVNEKQFHRILKRRAVREKLGWDARRVRKPYEHESRHNHAKRRPRGPKGRYLTAEELAAWKAENAGAAREQGKEASIDNERMGVAMAKSKGS